MKVLLTGAFGNLGTLVLEKLLDKQHQVTCFDIDTPVNRHFAKPFGNKATIIWGDICDYTLVEKAVQGQDTIIHLAAVIAPFSELKPDIAKKVNVDGTKNLLDAAAKCDTPPRFVFSSSISVFGNTQQLPPPRHSNDDVEATDHYSGHKITCETMIRDSRLDWIILRIAAMTDARMRHSNIEQLKLGLSVAANNRVEYIHPADAATAFVNALGSHEALGKTLLLGGGPSCQVTHAELLNAMTAAMGISLPESCFGDAVLYTDWLDTEESQALLDFQHHSFADLKQETFSTFRWRRLLIKPLSPLIRPLLVFIARR